MKKIKILTITLITCLMLSFVGCGKSNVPANTEAAEVFMEAMDEADIDTISENCTEKAFKSLGLKALDPSRNSDDFFRGMGMEKELFSEDALATVDEYGKYYSEALISDYTINEVTEEDNEGYVNITVATYDLQALKEELTEHFKTKLEPLVTAYTEENADELAAIYLENGEEAMVVHMFNNLMNDIMDLQKELIDNIETEDVTFILTLENIDDEWLVTDAEEID